MCILYLYFIGEDCAMDTYCRLFVKDLTEGYYGDSTLFRLIFVKDLSDGFYEDSRLRGVVKPFWLLPQNVNSNTG